MAAYIVRRLLLAMLTIWAISVLCFVIIQLPEGDWIDSYKGSRVGEVGEFDPRTM